MLAAKARPVCVHIHAGNHLGRRQTGDPALGAENGWAAVVKDCGTGGRDGREIPLLSWLDVKHATE